MTKAQSFIYLKTKMNKQPNSRQSPQSWRKEAILHKTLSSAISFIEYLVWTFKKSDTALSELSHAWTHLAN